VSALGSEERTAEEQFRPELFARAKFRPQFQHVVEAVTRALDQDESPSEILEDVVWRHRATKVAPKTVNQKRYVDSIRNNTITFGIGPAGTGKTFLAVALAAAALSRREVNRIILTRPAVEAGERLGFLPGDLNLLRVELDKLQREARSEVPPPDDALANQSRNRRIARLNAAMQVITHKLSARN